ncbi:DUF4391 domain-containing protein [Alphaproteobacteria bacterium]|nr:DUF4391 domain-containing protein [Alphaproteobacteria bacterium]
MKGLFRYPEKAKFGQIIPKAKIYEHAKLKPAQKARFVDLIQQIRWAHKLAPETTNLSATDDVREIQILRIRITQRNLSDDMLRIIDSAIPSTVIFELIYQGQIQVKGAHKQRKTEGSSRSSLSSYFASEWMSEDASRSDLPQALNLGILYDKILSELINPDAPKHGEVVTSLADKVAHQENIKAKEAEIAKIEQKLRRTKQFNKKQEINSALKKAKSDLEILKKNL